MSKVAAKLIAAQLNRKADSVLGLATGSTPLGIYRELARLHKEEGLDFAKVRTFNLDEYYGLAPDHPQSYRFFMEENLLKHVNIDPKNVHIPGGLAKDIEASCAEYEASIREAGGIDVQLLGIGRDGHIEDVKIVRGSFLLSQAAIDAVKQWQFQPYMLNGRPARTQTVITINF